MGRLDAVRGQIALWMLTKSSGRHSKKIRAQIALWMLTKFAMVFFIIALALVMISFTDVQKTAVCRTQAQSMARNIASTLVNVVNSPVEDERKVFALESSLSVGKSQLERYTIEIANIPSSDSTEAGSGSITVRVNTTLGCEGFGRATYDKTMKLADPETLTSLWKGKNLELHPSDVHVRDLYLVIVKCKPKKKGLSNYLYLKRCSAPLGTEINPNDCDPRLEQNPVVQCCGWDVVAAKGDPVCPA